MSGVEGGARAQVTWAAGWMLEITDRDAWNPRVHIWKTTRGTGTPALWSDDDALTWVYFGAQRPRLNGPLSSEWIARLMDEPRFATDLTGVFALVAVDKRQRRAIVVGDRLGIQSVHYTQSDPTAWRVSTHLMWLLLASRHDGRVSESGALAHFGFGYAIDPHDGVYRGVHKLPPAGYLGLDDRRVHVRQYWAVPTAGQSLTPEILDEAADALRTASAPSQPSDCVSLGLTAGKDSLCLASVMASDRVFDTATFGAPDSADQIQARQIATLLGVRHSAVGLCEPDEVVRWTSHVAFHSAGLATASYVDMSAFVDTAIPTASSFAIGEGGECVRDFFQAGGRAPIETLTREYMTAPQWLRSTLTQSFGHVVASYPLNLLSEARTLSGQADPDEFALHFYRAHRMPGNFSLRHAVLSPIRPKISPFLDARFLDCLYGLDRAEYAASAVHRTIVARNHPGLLRFFDAPVESVVPVQHWSVRVGAATGDALAQLLDASLPFCADVFDAAGVRALWSETRGEHSRALYHLFRVISFAVARSLLQRGTDRLTDISAETFTLDSTPRSAIQRSGPALVRS
jgi:hypothetical protein